MKTYKAFHGAEDVIDGVCSREWNWEKKSQKYIKEFMNEKDQQVKLHFNY